MSDIAQYDRKEELLSLLKYDFEKFMQGLKGKMLAYCVAKSRIQDVVDPSAITLNEPVEVQKPLKVETESGEILLGEDLKFAEFMEVWGLFIEALIPHLFNSKHIESSCEVLESLLLQQSAIRLIQPYLYFLLYL